VNPSDLPPGAEGVSVLNPVIAKRFNSAWIALGAAQRRVSERGDFAAKADETVKAKTGAKNASLDVIKYSLVE
jgi:hypothetical protein